MHLLLTDRLSCPRCGPEFGLILRADRMEDRRVGQGVLGCPNCRDSFSVDDGFMDLRAPPRGELPRGLALADGTPGGAWPPSAEAVERLRALLLLVRGPGTIALVGAPAGWASDLASAVEDIEVAALDPALTVLPDVPRVSRGVSAPGLPFFSGVLRGAVVDGRLGAAMLLEAARVVAPKCRVVVEHAPDSAVDVLREAGLDLLAEERGTVVAAKG